MMKNLKKSTYIIGSLVILPILVLFLTPAVKAETNIPENFNADLDLDTTYIYNVKSFNTSKPLQWYSLDWFAPPKGYANTTPGGQIKVSFKGFYDKDPNDIFNIFESPVPYLDVEFVENRLGNFHTNATFYNVSNGEADMNLLLGYNSFKSGFLIPINNFTWLKQQANAQDEPPYWNATVTIQESSKRITFDFQQKGGFKQRTISTYDKTSGLLVNTNTNVGNYTLEMTLSNLPKFASEETIPSFQISIIFGIITVISIIYIVKSNRRK